MRKDQISKSLLWLGFIQLNCSQIEGRWLIKYTSRWTVLSHLLMKQEIMNKDSKQVFELSTVCLDH